MSQRVIKTEADLENFVRFLATQSLPFTATLEKGLKRSRAQNRLQRQWMNEAAEQFGDRMPEDERSYCKLHFGVPILRRDSEVFCEKYDPVFKPLPYETKRALMAEPFDFPVTRLMKVKQKKEYLDAVWHHYSELGIILTDPNELSWAAHIASYRQTEPQEDVA